VAESATVLATLVDLLVPPTCANCLRTLPPDGEGGHASTARAGSTPPPPALCGDCLADLLDGQRRCPRCGEPGSIPPHRGCRRRGVRALAVLGGYDADLRSAVLRAKRPAGEPLARALGRLWAFRESQRCREWGVEVVVPVPMHWLRRFARGGSSVDRIAGGLAAGLRLPVVRGLRRARATPMQNQLPRDERHANVAGAFRPVGRGLAGKRVLLVDDVVTTGATLAECGRTALHAGARVVYAAVIARADGGPANGLQ
jgi:predicted amidophosphoribosyltransferase